MSKARPRGLSTLPAGLLAAAGLLLLLVGRAAPEADLAIDRVTLCAVVRGDGTCMPQPQGLYAPGSRLWARADLSGHARDDDAVDLELTLEIDSPEGRVMHRGTVLEGRRTVPRRRRGVFAVVTYDIPETAAEGDHSLRLALHDRLTGGRATAASGFTVGRRQRLDIAAELESSGRNRAVEITAHGFGLFNEIGGRQSPADRLYLVVETTWRNLLAVEIYRMDLEALADVLVDGQPGAEFIDLARYLEGGLPRTLEIAPGDAVRGFVTFTVPARFSSAELRYQDDRIGKGDVSIPLFDAAAGTAPDFPPPGIGETAEAEVAVTGGTRTTEIEPNDDPAAATALPAAESLEIEGRLTGDGDWDWYQLRVETAEASLWSFELSPLAEADLLFELRAGPLDRPRIDNGGVGEKETLRDVALAAGVYHLGVGRGSGGGAGEGYRLAARRTGAVTAGQESELNNRREMADPLHPGQPIRGRLGFERDEDWYLLRLAEEAAVSLTLSPPAGLDLALHLHDGGGRQLERWNLGREGRAERESVRLPAGEHYLVVRPAAIGSLADPWNSYTLTAVPLRGEGWNQDLESNDEPTRANPLSPGVVLRGSFQRQDEDWYAVDNTASGERVLKAVAWGGRGLRARVGIHSSGGELLGEGAQGNTFAFARVPRGISFVRAAGWDGPYHLLVRLDRPAPVTDPRQAAQLGLNALLPSAVGWQNSHQCFGCHVQSMAVMGGALGLVNGYQVHRPELEALVGLMRRQEREDYRYGGGGPMTAMLLNGMALAYYDELIAPAGAATRARLAASAEAVAAEQQPDGRWSHSWTIAPVHHGDIQATADTIQLLRRAPGDWDKALWRATTFLRAAVPETLQDHAYRVIGLARGGDPASGDLLWDEVEALRSLQNEDGGWSELPDLGSSPYATGQALYALRLGGVGPRDPGFARGVRWLTESQEWWGGWSPRNSSNSDRARVSDFPSTMWASIGLAGSLPTVLVTITTPLSGEPAREEMTIAVDAEAPPGSSVARVELLIDGEPIGGDVAAPFEWLWRPPELEVAHRIRAVAHDTQGRRGEHVVYTAPEGGQGTLQIVYPPGSADAAGLVEGTAVEIILDASGSMLQKLDGRRRIDIAKEVLLALTDQTLPEGSPLALRVFGHLEAEACRGRLEIPLQPLDRSAMHEAISRIEAIDRSKTPIGESLSLVAEDLATASDQKVVILVTDGEETCGGDPAAEVRSLRARGLEVRVNIVGFAIGDAGLKETFSEWAGLGGGRYFDATSAAELGPAVKGALQPPFEVLAQGGRLVASGSVGGGPVTLPAGIYTVKVATRPPRVFEGVRIRRQRQSLLQVAPGG